MLAEKECTTHRLWSLEDIPKVRSQESEPERMIDTEIKTEERNFFW